ncbi:MAG: hypothetical protein K2X27_20590 [Candidatus Obscuribacterales bacterium]|nr:hypothetical protein [Candidatus Obscuribacterales bacterium]
MKEKRSKSQLSKLGNNLQNDNSTITGGKLDLTVKSNTKDPDCSSGVCHTTWKPDALKR